MSANGCIDCEEIAGEGPIDADLLPETCAGSKKPCGHHCNHSWTHDSCCWCNRIWLGDDE